MSDVLARLRYELDSDRAWLDLRREDVESLLRVVEAAQAWVRADLAGPGDESANLVAAVAALDAL